ncbi:MAG: gamma-glutamyl-phosphate reductase, partial [Pseudomonadota bacterium]|nr:gamma-glutamyl-phosphate reductase [Pseudomonadota bacterium]
MIETIDPAALPIALIADMGQRARAAAGIVGALPTGAKPRALIAAARALRDGTSDILAANAIDMAHGCEIGLSGAMLD